MSNSRQPTICCWHSLVTERIASFKEDFLRCQVLDLTWGLNVSGCKNIAVVGHSAKTWEKCHFNLMNCIKRSRFLKQILMTIPKLIHPQMLTVKSFPFKLSCWHFFKYLTLCQAIHFFISVTALLCPDDACCYKLFQVVISWSGYLHPPDPLWEPIRAAQPAKIC